MGTGHFNEPPEVDIARPDDRLFDDINVRAGHQRCLCSRCGRVIASGHVVFRVLPASGTGEYRYHAPCAGIHELRCRWPPGEAAAASPLDAGPGGVPVDPLRESRSDDACASTEGECYLGPILVVIVLVTLLVFACG